MKSIRTTVVINEVLDHNLRVLGLQRKMRGDKPSGKGEMIEEAIKLLLERHGYPTDKKFELKPGG